MHGSSKGREEALSPSVARAALLGSALTGLIAYFLARREQRARDNDELRAALAVFGALLDRIGRHLEQLPTLQDRGRKVNRLIAGWRDLDWAIGRLSTATLGRGAIRTFDEFSVALNRLLLIAPQAVLDVTLNLTALLERFEARSPEWESDWREARSEFAAVARSAVPHL